MELLKRIKERAQKNLQRIVLPEGTELRTLTAANNVIRDKVAKLILLGNPSTITQLATDNNLTHINEAIIVNPDENPELDKYATLLYDLRKSKGMSMEQADYLEYPFSAEIRNDRQCLQKKGCRRLNVLPWRGYILSRLS